MNWVLLIQIYFDYKMVNSDDLYKQQFLLCSNNLRYGMKNIIGLTLVIASYSLTASAVKAEETGTFRIQTPDLQPIPGTGEEGSQIGLSTEYTNPALLNMNGIYLGRNTIVFESLDAELQYTLTESNCDESQSREYMTLRLGYLISDLDIRLRPVGHHGLNWSQPTNSYISQIIDYACSRAEFLRREENINLPTFSYTGLENCTPYDSRDTRTLPPNRRILEASLIYGHPGYVLSLGMDDDRQNINFLLDNKLNHSSRRAYSITPMEISSDGSFSITVGFASNVCTFEGIANFDIEVAARLFEEDGPIRMPLVLLRSQFCLENDQTVLRPEIDGNKNIIPIETENSTLFIGGYLNRCIPNHINGIYIADPVGQPTFAYQVDSESVTVIRGSSADFLASSQNTYFVLDSLRDIDTFDNIVNAKPYCIAGIFHQLSSDRGYSSPGSQIQCFDNRVGIESLLGNPAFAYPR